MNIQKLIAKTKKTCYNFEVLLLGGPLIGYVAYERTSQKKGELNYELNYQSN